DGRVLYFHMMGTHAQDATIFEVRPLTSDL
ncbi:MAG: hypothetical protein QOF24_3194, partial [Verrucomicrobiota bacterium]